LLVSIFLISLLSTVIFIKFAKRIGLIDIPNERSMHIDPIARGVGIAFVMAVLIGLFIFDYEHLKTYYYIYLAIIFVLLAGVWDDMKDISPKIKFIFIFYFLLLFLLYQDTLML